MEINNRNTPNVSQYKDTNKLCLYLSSSAHHVTSSIVRMGEIIGLKRSEQRNDLAIILFNLFTNNHKPIRVSRSKSKSRIPIRYNPSNLGIKSTITALNCLKESGYISQKLGSFDLSTNTGPQTTITSTNKLRVFFTDGLWERQDISLGQPEYVHLRKQSTRKNSKRIVDYKDSEYSNWLRKELSKYNDLLNDSDIRIGNHYFEDLSIRKMFIDYNQLNKNGETLLAFGGRMHGPWCNFSSNVRKGILINNEKTIELDYTAAHVNAMYLVITGSYYDGDPYDGLTIDGELIPRSVVKQVATIMQHTERRGVIPALEDAYRNKDEVEKYKQIVEYRETKKLVRPIDIVNHYLIKHSAISSFYLQGKMVGSEIQCWEADMVFEVVQQLTNRGIPVLTVYDSFIVQERYEDLLDGLMKNTTYIDRRK